MNTQSHHRPPVELKAFSVEEFCHAHSISKAFLYKLLRRNAGPQITKIGRRTLISAEAAAEWRNSRHSGASHDHK